MRIRRQGGRGGEGGGGGGGGGLVVGSRGSDGAAVESAGWPPTKWSTDRRGKANTEIKGQEPFQSVVWKRCILILSLTLPPPLPRFRLRFRASASTLSLSRFRFRLWPSKCYHFFVLLKLKVCSRSSFDKQGPGGRGSETDDLRLPFRSPGYTRN